MRGRPGVVVAVVVAAIVTVGGIAWLSTGTSSTTGSTTGSTKTPQSTASTIVAVFKSGNLTQICTLTSSSEKARCRADFRPITGTVTYEHLALRSVYTQGDRALVVMTGGICPSSGTCQSSRSFRAATGSGGSFDQGYADATGPPSSSSPFIVPLVRQDGKWLVTGF